MVIILDARYSEKMMAILILAMLNWAKNISDTVPFVIHFVLTFKTEVNSEDHSLLYEVEYVT